MHNLSIALRFAVAVLALNIVAVVAADSLPDDQKTYLQAASAKCLRQQDDNICIYLGGVNLTQGTTSMRAEQIAIHRLPEGKISKIVASGKHSHYSGVMADNGRPVDADADNIIIVPEQNTMTLLHHAQLTITQDQSGGRQKPINAKANKVTIYSKQGMMNLTGAAEVLVGEDKYSGPYIDYQFK